MIFILTQGKGLMKTFWIMNHWDDEDTRKEDQDEPLPGELMTYSDVKICANSATFGDSGDSNLPDRRVWREEDVFVGALHNSQHCGGIHQC